MRPSRTGGSAADSTRSYIDDHPSIREVLREDLLNYTALARKIQAEQELRNEEAVTIACRRYQHELAQETVELAAIRDVVSRSRLHVHSRIALIRIREDTEAIDHLLDLARRTLPNPRGRSVFQVFQGPGATTILCEESFLTTLLPEVPARLRVVVERGLAVLAFRSTPAVSETPGVVSFIVDALYRRGINCLETVSVHTDSIFVFRDGDLIRAYQTLSDLASPETDAAGAELPTSRVA